MNHAHRTNGDRSTEELRRDIEHHRDSLDQTLSALQHRLSPGELLDEGLKHLKTGPGEFATNLGRTAKNNPIPLLLTGVGLAWLMWGDSRGANESVSKVTRSSDRQSLDELPTDHDQLTATYAAYLLEQYPFTDDEIECVIYDDLGPDYAAVHAARTGYRGNDEAEKETSSGLKDTVARAGDKVSRASATLKDRAQDTQREAKARMESVREKMAQTSDDAKQRIAQAREAAGRRVRQGRQDAMEAGRVAARRGRELVDRYPLSLMAVGVAAGAALGTALPETRRENRLMGDASDNLKAEAKARFEEEKDRAQRVAAAARDAAADEAESQDLTAEGLKAQASDVAERAKRVAGAARDEAERQDLTGQAVREQIHDAKDRVKKVAGAAVDAAKDEGRHDG